MRRVGLTVGILVKIESRTAALPLTSTLQMASDFGNPMPSRPLTLDAVYFGAVPVSFEAVDGHTLPFVSSEWTEDASSLPTVLSRFNFAPPSSDGDLHPPQSSRRCLLQFANAKCFQVDSLCSNPASPPSTSRARLDRIMLQQRRRCR